MGKRGRRKESECLRLTICSEAGQTFLYVLLGAWYVIEYGSPFATCDMECVVTAEVEVGTKPDHFTIYMYTYEFMHGSHQDILILSIQDAPRNISRPLPFCANIPDVYK